MRFYRRRRRLSPAEKEANEVARQESLKLAMTCQVCGRRILANTGLIAHHGYERPGDGWQSKSCYGAKRLPYEVERDALAEWIKILEERYSSLQQLVIRIQNEEIVCHFNYETGAYHNRQTIYVTVSRENFDLLQLEHYNAFSARGYNCYEKVKQSIIDRHESSMRYITCDIVNCNSRYNRWRITHKRLADKWVANWG